MIQDMFEPEYYLSRYETIDTEDGTKVYQLRCETQFRKLWIDWDTTPEKYKENFNVLQ
jgi:hypothetical protein